MQPMRNMLPSYVAKQTRVSEFTEHELMYAQQDSSLGAKRTAEAIAATQPPPKRRGRPPKDNRQKASEPSVDPQ